MQTLKYMKNSVRYRTIIAFNRNTESASNKNPVTHKGSHVELGEGRCNNPFCPTIICESIEEVTQLGNAKTAISVNGKKTLEVS
jgi:hypothetical protein